MLLGAFPQMHSHLNTPSMRAPYPVCGVSQPLPQHNSKPATPFYARQLPTRVISQAPAVSDLLPRDISSRFGLRLRELRKSHNMTQLRMAIDFGIDRSFISDVELGKKSISLTFLEVIALGLGLELSDLVRGL
jgi:DNA-binding XRE family transcriptional regulator